MRLTLWCLKDVAQAGGDEVAKHHPAAMCPLA